MPQIVRQSGGHDADPVLYGEFLARLVEASVELRKYLKREVTSAETVLEPCMLAVGVHVCGMHTQLLDVAHALKKEVIDNMVSSMGQYHLTVDRVVKS